MEFDSKLIDIQDSEGKTAMHYAAMANSEATIISLAKFTPDLSKKDKTAKFARDYTKELVKNSFIRKFQMDKIKYYFKKSSNILIFFKKVFLFCYNSERPTTLLSILIFNTVCVLRHHEREKQFMRVNHTLQKFKDNFKTKN